MKAKKTTIDGQQYLLVALIPGQVTTITTMQDESGIKTTIRHSDLPSEPQDIGPLTFMTDSFTVKYSGRMYRTTPTTFKLLFFLAKHPNKVLTYEQLAVASGTSNNKTAVGGTVNRVKLQMCGKITDWIRNVKSVGYIYEPPKAAKSAEIPLS